MAMATSPLALQAPTAAPLLHQLPPELRLMIFRDVLGPPKYLEPVFPGQKDGIWKQPNMITQHSLLHVNRATYAETSDAFFDIKHQIGLQHITNLSTLPQFAHGRYKRLRQVMLCNWESVDVWRDFTYLSRVIALTEELPRLESLTILYDGLLNSGSPLDRWLRESGIEGASYEYSDVAQCQLVRPGQTGQETSKKIIFSHNQLATAWGNMNASAECSRLIGRYLAMMETFRGKSEQEQDELVLQADLGDWMALIEGLRIYAKEIFDLAPGQPVWSEAHVPAERFKRHLAPFMLADPAPIKLFPPTYKGNDGFVCEWSNARNGSRVLEWLTGLLLKCKEHCPNLFDFKASEGPPDVRGSEGEGSGGAGSGGDETVAGAGGVGTEQGDDEE